MNDPSVSAHQTDVLGYRAKFGVLVPMTNTIVQPEFDDMRPAGVTNHVVRMEPATSRLKVGDIDAYRARLERGNPDTARAIRDVMPCAPQQVILGHSIDSFRGGMAGAERMKAEFEAVAGVPVIIPALAFAAALRAIDAGKRVAALTPYWPPGDEQVIAFFNSAGYEVTGLIGLKCRGPLAIAAVTQAQVMSALTELASTKPDVIVQPGTNLALAGFAAAASASLGIPVISCNTATYWHALRSFGLQDKDERFGVLFSKF